MSERFTVEMGFHQDGKEAGYGVYDHQTGEFAPFGYRQAHEAEHARNQIAKSVEENGHTEYGFLSTYKVFEPSESGDIGE